MGSEPPISFEPRVGLCSLCRHSRRLENGRGSTFWMCELALTDRRFRKYPPLPVRECSGFELPPDDSTATA